MRLQSTTNRGNAARVRTGRPRFLQPVRLVAIAVLLGLSLAVSHGAPLIHLGATTQSPGLLGVWPNTGSLAGDFLSWADGPEVIVVDGVNGAASPYTNNLAGRTLSRLLVR